MSLDEQVAPFLQGFASRNVLVNGFKTHWMVSEGSGPPLVLLHGDYGSWRHWVKNLQDLSSSYCVLVPDLPGYGDSDTPRKPFSEQEAARRMGEALMLLHEGPIRLVGFSLGGIIAGHLADQKTSRVSYLVICGSGGLGVPQLHPAPRLERLDLHASDQEIVATHRRNLQKLMINDSNKIDELCCRIHHFNIQQTRVKAASVPRSDSLSRALMGVTAKLGAIWGGQDQYCDEQGIRASEARIRKHCHDLEFHIVPGAGHWVPYECPTEFNYLLRKLLLRR